MVLFVNRRPLPLAHLSQLKTSPPLIPPLSAACERSRESLPGLTSVHHESLLQKQVRIQYLIFVAPHHLPLTTFAASTYRLLPHPSRSQNSAPLLCSQPAQDCEKSWHCTTSIPLISGHRRCRLCHLPRPRTYNLLQSTTVMEDDRVSTYSFQGMDGGIGSLDPEHLFDGFNKRGKNTVGRGQQ